MEIKHWKSDKRRFSTLAWSYAPLDRLVDVGQLSARVRALYLCTASSVPAGEGGRSRGGPRGRWAAVGAGACGVPGSVVGGQERLGGLRVREVSSRVLSVPLICRVPRPPHPNPHTSLRQVRSGPVELPLLKKPVDLTLRKARRLSGRGPDLHLSVRGIE